MKVFALLAVLAVAPLNSSYALQGSASADAKPAVFSDDFSDPATLRDNYQVKEGPKAGWTIKEGVLIADQLRPEHGTVIRKELAFDDFDCEIDFRFSGGKSFNFVIDDKKEKSVHAGHICRVSVFRKSVRIGDDKKGTMNQEVRKLRKDKNLSADKKQALEKLLASTQASAKVKLKDDQWYRLRVRIEGDLMEAYLDGKLLTSLRSEGIAHPTKSQFGMTVNGTTIDFDNLKVTVAGQ